jgi:hypothetical protein
MVICLAAQDFSAFISSPSLEGEDEGEGGCARREFALTLALILTPLQIDIMEIMFM